MKNTRKKVVFVLPALTAGGAERVLITLMNGLDRGRFDPVLLSVNAEGPMLEFVEHGLPVHIMSEKDRVGRSLPRLRTYLRMLKPDVVVSTMAPMNFGVLLLKPFFPRTRFIVREAITPSFILQNRGMAKPLIRFLYKYLYPKADLVISPAQIIVDEFGSVLKMKMDTHVVLPNPVDIGRIRLEAHELLPARPSNKVHYVASGRLHHQKGFDRLIEIMPKEGDYHLTILGEGPERAKLEKLVAARGLEDKITLPGLNPNPWPHYAGSDVFLLPSRWEGLPNVVLESLACGTPVIATRESGGIAEIAAHSDQVTIVNDMKEFAAAMKKVKANPSLRFRASLLPNIYLPENVMKIFSGLLIGKPVSRKEKAAQTSG